MRNLHPKQTHALIRQSVKPYFCRTVNLFPLQLKIKVRVVFKVELLYIENNCCQTESLSQAFAFKFDIGVG